MVMQTFARRLVERLRREVFLTTQLSIVISPIYIIRRGLHLAIRDLAPSFTGHVLDFGCGSKPYESLFTGVESYIGVDMLDTGHPHRQSRVDVFYDGERLPFPDSAFDGIVSFEVLEHVFNPETVLGELRRVLKPGGMMLLTLPFAWDEHEIPFDFARYTCYGLRSLLERTGFEVVYQRKTCGYVLAIGQLICAYLYQHVLPRGRIGAKIAQLIFLFPLNVFFLLADRLLPRRDQLYCNNVVVARRRSEQGSASLADSQLSGVDQ
jgi:SAM-dependent methyltransferase